MEEDIQLDNILRHAYSDIINGKSLREVSKEVGIERRRLKKLIESILSEEEKQSFNNAVNRKNNRKKISNINRDKKAKALESEEYKKVVEELTKRGVQPLWIEQIYNRCQERPQTQISRDTLATKLLELLDYFSTRNENITEESNGYISIEDVIEMILRNPRIITSDIKNKIIPKCAIITAKNDENVVLANVKIKSNPGIFNKSSENIRKGR